MAGQKSTFDGRWSGRGDRASGVFRHGRPRRHRCTPTDQQRPVHLRPRLRVHCGLRIQNHLYRWCPRHLAAPGLPDRTVGGKSDYLEVCYLLLNGELPTAEEKERFINTVSRHTMVHEQLSQFFKGFRRDAHRWRSCAVSLGRCLRSITTRSTSTIPTTVRCVLRLIAKCHARRHVLQILHRPAVHVSAKRSQLRGQLPAHDVWHPLCRI